MGQRAALPSRRPRQGEPRCRVESGRPTQRTAETVDPPCAPSATDRLTATEPHRRLVVNHMVVKQRRLYTDGGQSHSYGQSVVGDLSGELGPEFVRTTGRAKRCQ